MKLASLRRDLLTDRESALCALAALEPDAASIRGDDVDVAVLAEQQDAINDRRGRLQQRVQSIDRALERMAAGEYGDCEDCGEAIAARRLKVMPDAEHCIGCQERIERAAEPQGAPARVVRTRVPGSLEGQ